MLEVLGQTNFATGKTYTDLAASVQFIILTRMRLDIGYRLVLVKDLQWTATQPFLVGFE